MLGTLFIINFKVLIAEVPIQHQRATSLMRPGDCLLLRCDQRSWQSFQCIYRVCPHNATFDTRDIPLQ